MRSHLRLPTSPSRGRTPSCRATAGASPCSTDGLAAARVGGGRRLRGPRLDVRAAPRPARAGVRGRRRRGRARDRHRPRCASSTTAGRSRPPGSASRSAATSATTTASGATASPCGDLGGTTRTLDDVDGRDRARARHRVARRASPRSTTRARSCSRTTAGSARATAARIDLYVFAYGHDYAEALRGVLRRLGPASRCCRAGRSATGGAATTATAPTATSRCWTASSRGAPAVLGRGARHGLAPRRLACPSSYGSGWTGYSWEPELFPDPEGFLAELHRRGLRVTLNVHPADGVRAFEDAYPAMAEALGRDPASGRADRVRHHRPRVPRGLLRGPAPPARGPGRRLLVARLAAGPVLAHRRASTRCGCSTTSTSSTPAATAGGR